MNRSKTSLFLMELIIAILFFSLSCAVCIQLFFKAHTDHFRITTDADDEFSIFFDEDWNPITEASHVTYEIQCEIYDKDDFQTAVITALDGSEELYSLTSEIFQGK